MAGTCRLPSAIGLFRFGPDTDWRMGPLRRNAEVALEARCRIENPDGFVIEIFDRASNSTIHSNEDEGLPQARLQCSD
jgi:hypothetical protein